MFAVIFLWKPTSIAALIFLPRTFKSYEENILCLHLMKRWKPVRTFQKNAAILNSIKVLSTFHKIFIFGYLEN